MPEASLYAPVCLFAYNRPDHTKQTIEALLRNPESKNTDLFVFSDGPKKEFDRETVGQLREYLKSIRGFQSLQIFEKEKNQGLAKSIIEGVSEMLATFPSVIVLEDDIVTSPHFLKYMNEALKLYESEERVACIHAYLPDLDIDLKESFFLRGTDCWGWGTWRRAWKYFEEDGSKLLAELKAKRLTYEFDVDGTYPYTEMLENQIAGRVNSWAIRWHASAFLKEMMTLYPPRTLVQNIGLDGSGEHCGEETGYKVNLSSQTVELTHVKPEESLSAREAYKRFFRKTQPTFWSKVKSKISRRLREI